MTEHKPLSKINDKIFHCNVECYAVEEVISAREGLKKDIEDLYHKLGKVAVWRASNDEVCDMTEEYVLLMIDKWFGGK